MAARSVIALVEQQALGPSETQRYLERRGFDVQNASEEWALQALLSRVHVDLLLLDGDHAASWWQAALRDAAGIGTAVVVAASGRPVVDRVLALEMGAADFVEKPYQLRELASRLSGILARAGKTPPELVYLENSTVDLRAALVMHRSGTEEQLSAGQVSLLRYFLRNQGRVLNREDIMEHAPADSWDAFDRSIDSRIVRLRRKLDTGSIVTVRGSGYRFDSPEQ